MITRETGSMEINLKNRMGGEIDIGKLIKYTISIKSLKFDWYIDGNDSFKG